MAQAGSTYEQILKHYYSGIAVGLPGGAAAAAATRPVLTGGAANP
jgi:peptidoglycan hydrolase-like amidase